MRKLDYAIVFVSDMKRSIAFYRDVLGLPLKFESPEWTEFATEGATVALHATGDRGPEKPKTAAGQCHLGFQVDDIDAFHNGMLAKGVTCLQPPKMQDFGAKLAGYADPDGLAISISQRR